MLQTIILHNPHTIPVLPLFEPLSCKRDLYPDACLAQCPYPEWFHASSWDYTPGTPRLKEQVGIQVLPGTILVARRGMHGGVAAATPQLEGLAHVVEWR